MSFLLDIIYVVLLVVLSPWFLYQAVSKGKYRRGWGAKLLGLAPHRERNGYCVWLHAVSVGEVNLLGTLISEIQRRRPDWQCVVSTTTATGYALARRKYAPRPVFYCPLDFSWAVRRALRRIRPDLLVLAELELWPNLIRAAKRRGARVAVVNGRLSERSFRGYRRLRPWVRRLLRQIDLIAVQNPQYADRFLALGAEASHVHVTGSMKFDGAQTDRNNEHTRRLARLAGIKDDDIVFLAGSTQEPEEALALDAYSALCAKFPKLRLILVPRHPERFAAVARLLDESEVRWQLRTALCEDNADPAARVLLVDAVGELGAWWGTATIAFVGGSLGRRGGQNMIEPAAYGAAVSFGPNTHNFRDAVDQLLAHNAAVVVRDGAELTAFLRRALAEPPVAAELGRRARALVRSQLGATSATVDLLERIVTPCEFLENQRIHSHEAFNISHDERTQDDKDVQFVKRRQAS